MEQSLLFSLSIYAQFTDFSMSGEIFERHAATLLEASSESLINLDFPEENIKTH